LLGTVCPETLALAARFTYAPAVRAVP